MASNRLISVRVRCIDRATKEFFDRDFWTDPSSLPDEQRAQVEKLAKAGIRPRDFLQIRPLLRLGSWRDDPEVLARSQSSSSGGHTMFAVTDYFEDDEGHPLDEIGLAQIITGQEYPILAGHVGSVLRLGPTELERQELWSVDSANAVAHFFQLVEVIGSGDWLKSELAISTGGMSKPDGINSFKCPGLGQMYSILLPIRQLYASDDAFNHACNIYLRHAKDVRKRWWIEQNKAAFNKYLRSVPVPKAIDNCTVRELLDLVMYGAGLIHYAKSKPEVRQNFKEAVTRHHRERVIFAFIGCCHALFGFAAGAYYILRQDVENWQLGEGIALPDLVFMSNLFSSHQLHEPGAVS